MSIYYYYYHKWPSNSFTKHARPVLNFCNQLWWHRPIFLSYITKKNTTRVQCVYTSICN